MKETHYVVRFHIVADDTGPSLDNTKMRTLISSAVAADPKRPPHWVVSPVTSHYEPPAPGSQQPQHPDDLRLDWLQARPLTMAVHTSEGWEIYDCPSENTPSKRLASHADLRVAIDAARRHLPEVRV